MLDALSINDLVSLVSEYFRGRPEQHKIMREKFPGDLERLVGYEQTVIEEIQRIIKLKLAVRLVNKVCNPPAVTPAIIITMTICPMIPCSGINKESAMPHSAAEIMVPTINSFK